MELERKKFVFEYAVKKSLGFLYRANNIFIYDDSGFASQGIKRFCKENDFTWYHLLEGDSIRFQIKENS